ncbi:uncharacterized protein LOC126668327 [Mercurialis annua]|uniref:uncharacterized protein LOC126668327 n=1 Tax=Mercurialis annua TaxID=3986 RepID=UPI00215E70F4|nr:uncharacterized protein LOC126668327 [Mercurialis annua]
MTSVAVHTILTEERKEVEHDPLGIETEIQGRTMRRVSIDSGGTTSVITWKAYQAKRGSMIRIRLQPTEIRGVGESRLHSMGTVTLRLTSKHRTGLRMTQFVLFHVVDERLPFSMILGRTFLYKSGEVLDMSNLWIGFLIEEGAVIISEAIGSWRTSLKARDWNVHAHQRSYKRGVEEALTYILEIKGVELEVACHELNVDPASKVVKQKKRRHSKERQKAIAEEVEKLQEAGFIKSIKYPE